MDGRIPAANAGTSHWLADEASHFGPVFWHLDGCNVDEFEFSSYVTREEYEAELENDA